MHNTRENEVTMIVTHRQTVMTNVVIISGVAVYSMVEKLIDNNTATKINHTAVEYAFYNTWGYLIQHPLYNNINNLIGLHTD